MLSNHANCSFNTFKSNFFSFHFKHLFYSYRLSYVICRCGSLLLRWFNHEFWPDILVEILLTDHLELHCTFLESNPLLVCIFGRLGSQVITLPYQ